MARNRDEDYWVLQGEILSEIYDFSFLAITVTVNLKYYCSTLLTRYNHAHPNHLCHHGLNFSGIRKDQRWITRNDFQGDVITSRAFMDKVNTRLTEGLVP